MSLTPKRIFWLLLLAVIVFAALALVSARTRRISRLVAEQSSIPPRATNQPRITVASLNRPERQIPERQINEQLKNAAAQSYDFAAPQGQANTEQVEVEVLTLGPNGFEPAELTRPQGRFMLAITNHTQTNDLSLELKHQAGHRLNTVRLGRGRTRSLSDLNLPPGQYVLSETNHPRWICRVRISAR